MNARKVPTIGHALLWLVLGPDDREYILGDLEEQFARRVVEAGRTRATLWYWRQLLESVGPSARRRAQSGHRRQGGAGKAGPSDLPPRNTSSSSMIDRLAQDTRYATRTLLREPGWTAAAVLTLAVAIGATTAVFSVVNAVLLRPLGFDDPEQLVALEFHPFDQATQEAWAAADEPRRLHLRRSTTYPNFELWREATTDVFEEMAVYDDAWERTVNLGDGGERVPVAFVSAGFFRLLPAQPVRGRAFRDDEDLPGSAPVAVISHELWQRRFAGKDGIVGTTISVADRPHTIVGVLPAGFAFRAKSIPLWLPMAEATRSTGAWNYELVGRLRPELSIEQADALLGDRSITVATRNGVDQEFGASPVTLRAAIVGEVRPILLILSTTVAAVLLIACINVVNLMLTRATGRGKEQLVRAALGAGRLRLAQQHLTESSIVGVMGGALGVALAALLTDAFVRLNPTALPRQHEVAIDGGVLGFTFGLSLTVGLVVGLLPAWRAGTTDLASGLGTSPRGAADGSGLARARDGLVIAQLALAMVLLVAAGLLLRSFAGMLSRETGIDSHGVLTFETELPESRYPEFDDGQYFYDELLARIRTFPGVRSAALAVYLPADGWFHSWTFDVDGYSRADDERLEAEVKQVTPDYFRTLGIGVIDGRTFDRRDGLGPPVAVINESMARMFWPQGSAVGRQILLDADRRTIVGIVDDVRYRGDDRDAPQVYIPYAEGTFRWGMDVLVRTDGRPEDLTAAIRRLVTSIDPEVTVFDVRTLGERLSGSLAEPRFRTLLLGAFGLAALGLSVIGVYGVMAYAVARRVRELGIRMALGASRVRVMMHVLRRGAAMTMIGIGIGTLAAYTAVGVLQSYLFHLDARDPATIAVSALVLATASMLASYVPARRAARVDPQISLQAE